MFANWKWDTKHSILLAAFVIGFGWSLYAVFSALPSGQSTAQVLAILVPLLVVAVGHVVSFFTNPPTNPADALQEGEASVQASSAGKAGSRGCVRLNVAAGLATAAIGLVVAVPGCSWFQKNEPAIVTDASADAQCVLTAILGGATAPASIVAACAPMSVDQVLAIAKSLFDFYALGQTDSGLAGAALPPFKGIPSALSAADMAKLQAFVSGK